jgi:hypothetical protein
MNQILPNHSFRTTQAKSMNPPTNRQTHMGQTVGKSG